MVADDDAERETLVASLESQFRVRAITTSSAPDVDPAEVVVMQWAAGSEATVSELRTREATRDAHVVALVDAPSHDTVLAMYEAGVDDFVRRPVCPGELMARVRLPRRSGAWAHGPQGAPALAATADAGRLAGSNAFKNMGEVVAADLSQMIGELEISEGWQVVGELRGACIPMSVASESAEIRVSIVVDEKLVSSLAEALLGDAEAPSDMLEDMLREMVNTAGGTVKRAAADDGIVVTTGLPVNEQRTPKRNEQTRCWTLRVVGSKMQLGVIGEILRHPTERRPARHMRDGMVVSRDVHDASGAVVVASGTRLTSTSIARIQAVLGGHVAVEVMVADD